VDGGYGRLHGEGLRESAVNTARVANGRQVDECHSQCVDQLQLYGCAEDATVMSFDPKKCTWRK